MASIVKNFDPSLSFWEANPAVITIPEFKALYDEQGKKRSSKIMWAISFLLDQNPENPWRNTEKDETVGLIKSDYLEDDNFDFEDYDEQLMAYKRHLMTHGERSLLNLKHKLEERDQFLKEAQYDMETVKIIDTAQKDTLAIFKVYEQIKEIISKEVSDDEIVGKKSESASEKGMI